MILFLIPFLIHIFSWRMGLVRKTSGNILYLFVLSWAVIFVLLFALRPLFPVLLPITNLTLIHSFLLAASLFAAYLLTYPGLEADSPSGIILLAVERAGATGLEPQALENIVSGKLNDQAVILKRLQDLHRSQILTKTGNLYFITQKGRLFLRFFTFPRRLFTSRSPGG